MLRAGLSGRSCESRKPVGPAVRSFQNTLSRFHLVSPGDRVLVALSGGADSVALLHLLVSFRKKLNISVAACHVHHHLRGRESDRDELFTRDLCESLGVEFTVRHIRPRSVMKRTKLSLEMASRDLRYRALEDARTELSCNRIATAHHLDDLSETVLLRLLKGSGLSVQAAIPLERGVIIRPLMFCMRSDLENLLKRSKIRWVTDSSNADTEPDRNYLRREVLPLLNRRFPAFRRKLAEFYETALAEEEFWDTRSARLAKYTGADGETRVIDKAVFRCGASRAELRRFLRGFLMQAGLARTDSLSGLVDRIIGEGLRSDGNREIFSSPQIRIVSSYGVIRIGGTGQNFPKELKYVKLKRQCSVFFGSRELRFEPVDSEEAGTEAFRRAVKNAGRKDPDTAVFQPGSLGMIEVRPRENGDYLRIRGGGKKKIKDLLMDLKVPRADRESVLVLASDGGETVAVHVPRYGFRVSENFYVRTSPGAGIGRFWRVTLSHPGDKR